MTKIEEYQKNLADLDEEIVKLKAAFDVARDAYLKIASERESLIQSIDEQKVADKTLTIADILHYDGMQSTVMFREAHKFLALYYISTLGYYPRTNQRCLEYRIFNDTDYEKVIQGIKILLPHLKAAETVDGVDVRIIMYESDDDKGIFYIAIDEDGRACRLNLRYHEYKFISDWTTIEDAVEQSIEHSYSLDESEF